MSVPYCTQNVVDFYRTIEWFFHTNQTLSREIFEQDHTKFSRTITHLPFSILALQSAQASSKKNYYILSNMHVGEAGTFGRIKVGYPMRLNDNICNVDFSRPTAVKISNHVGTVSEDAQYFMAENFRELYSIGTWKRHAEAGDRFKFYYTMPLYQGQDLFEYLQPLSAAQPLSFEIALNIILQSTLELKKIHDLNYVHLDIKLENILFYYDEIKNTLSLKLIDWDSLRKVGTALQKRIGTEDLMAPEINNDLCNTGFCIVHPSMDIFSLGHVFKNIIALTDFQKVLPFSKTEMKLLGNNTVTSLKKRLNLAEILDTLEEIFLRSNIQKISSGGDMENSSLLPEGFDHFIQLNIAPSLPAAIPEQILPRTLIDITNPPIKRKASMNNSMDDFQAKRSS